ncbi:hypothetical protein C3L33_02304, partial [Rhododendron williamsianum]
MFHKWLKSYYPYRVVSRLATGEGVCSDRCCRRTLDPSPKHIGSEGRKLRHISLSIDHYKALGFDRSASKEEIKQAFRKLAMQNHPDRHSNSTKAVRDSATPVSSSSTKPTRSSSTIAKADYNSTTTKNKKSPRTTTNNNNHTAGTTTNNSYRTNTNNDYDPPRSEPNLGIMQDTGRFCFDNNILQRSSEDSVESKKAKAAAKDKV